MEPYLDRMLDLSLQMEITSSRIRLFQTRQFIVGDQHEYRGAYLGRRIPGLQSGQASFFHQILPHWKRFLRDLGMAVRQKGYQGPLGVDACLWKDRGGNLKFKPLIELNPRWTMGRVALDLEKYLAPKTNAGWFFIPLRIVREKGYGDFEEFASYLKKKYPIQFSGTKRIESGVVFTNDPKRAQSVLTVLATLPNPDLAPHSSS